MRFRPKMLLVVVLVTQPFVSAVAFGLEREFRDLQPQADVLAYADIRVAQNGGMSLSEAIESVRNKTNGRIVSAETQVKNGREVHHIKVLTKDGKVKTHRVQGRKRGNG